MATALICLGFIGSSNAAKFASGGAPRAAAQELPANDRLLVLNTRAGPFRYLDGWKRSGWWGKRTEYRSALAAFGPPTRMEPYWLLAESMPEAYGDDPKTAGYCFVTWASAGITVDFFSWSGDWPPDFDATVAPPKMNPCARASLEQSVLTKIEMFGPGWRNRTGFRIGERRPPRRPYIVETNVKIPGGHVGIRMSAFNTDEQGRVKSIAALINGWP